MFAKELTIANWIQLSNEERLLMRELFNIPRSGGTIMLDGKLQTDGHTVYDLRAVNLESMQKFLDVISDDWDELLTNTILEMRNILVLRKRAQAEEVKEQIANNLQETINAMIVPIMNSVKKLPPEGQIALAQEIDKLLVEFANPSVATEPIQNHVTESKGTRKASKGKVHTG